MDRIVFFAAFIVVSIADPCMDFRTNCRQRCDSQKLVTKGTCKWANGKITTSVCNCVEDACAPKKTECTDRCTKQNLTAEFKCTLDNQGKITGSECQCLDSSDPCTKEKADCTKTCSATPQFDCKSKDGKITANSCSCSASSDQTTTGATTLSKEALCAKDKGNCERQCHTGGQSAQFTCNTANGAVTNTQCSCTGATNPCLQKIQECRDKCQGEGKSSRTECKLGKRNNVKSNSCTCT